MARTSQVSTEAIESTYLCRESQVQQLSSLLIAGTPSPPAIVVHGPVATCKTSVVKRVLADSTITHASINCAECITPRHLFERTLTLCQEQINTSIANSLGQQSRLSTQHTRCDNINTLAVQLEQMTRNLDKFVLVFDGLDRQRESTSNLLPAVVRLPECVPVLTIILIQQSLPLLDRSYCMLGIPHVFFPAYDKEQICRIVTCASPRDPFNTKLLEKQKPRSKHQENIDWLWEAFCESIWDSLGHSAANDVVSFRNLAEKMWKPFIESVEKRDKTPLRDFPRHWLANRSLFSDENMLIDRIIPVTSEDYPKKNANAVVSQPSTIPKTSHYEKAVFSPPQYREYLLCAAYLASFNPPRRDYQYFSKYSESKRKRKGGIGKTGRAPKHQQISRRMLKPGPFSLERLLAIFHAIFPVNYVKPTADIYTQIASLTSLRLIVKSSMGAGDAIDPNARWRVNVSWDYVVAVGKKIDFDIADYAIE